MFCNSRDRLILRALVPDAEIVGAIFYRMEIGVIDETVGEMWI